MQVIAPNTGHGDLGATFGAKSWRPLPHPGRNLAEDSGHYHSELSARPAAKGIRPGISSLQLARPAAETKSLRRAFYGLGAGLEFSPSALRQPLDATSAAKMRKN